MESKNNKDKDIEQIPMTEKLGEGTQYRFVRETIIDRKTKIKQEIIKTAINLMLIVGACIVTSLIFIHFINDKQNKEDTKQPDSKLVDATVSAMKETTQETTEDNNTNETPEERAEKTILSSTIEFKGYSMEKFTTFTGMVVSKSKDIIAITNSDNVEGLSYFSAKISGNKEITAEVYMVDSEVHIAYLKIKRVNLSEKEIKSIGVSDIAANNIIKFGAEVKYIGWGSKSGMTLLDGKVVSQGASQLATDTIYNKYMIDIRLSDIKDGFAFDDKGNLIAMGMVQEEETGKIAVIDLTGLRNDIYTGINNGYLIKVGIVSQQVTEEVRKLVGMDVPNGMFVTNVGEGTPAYDGGIMVGDVIYKIDDTNIEKYTDYRKYLNSKKKGDTITVYLYRRLGTRLNPYEIKVELGERK